MSELKKVHLHLEISRELRDKVNAIAKTRRTSIMQLSEEIVEMWVNESMRETLIAAATSGIPENKSFSIQ